MRVLLLTMLGWSRSLYLWLQWSFLIPSSLRCLPPAPDINLQLSLRQSPQPRMLFPPWLTWLVTTYQLFLSINVTCSKRPSMTQMTHPTSTPCLLPSLVAPRLFLHSTFHDCTLCVYFHNHFVEVNEKINCVRADPLHVLLLATSPVPGSVPRSQAPTHVGEHLY